MANWSKRTTRTGSNGQRTTKTFNAGKGKYTYSNSKRVGNTRTTYSTNSADGKIKVYTTQHHPILGWKRTTETVNKTTPYKSASRSYKYKPRRRRSSKYKSSSAGTGLSLSGTLWLIAFGCLFLAGAAWYVWFAMSLGFLIWYLGTDETDHQ